MFWIYEALIHQSAIPAAPLNLFRILFSAAILLKFSVETYRGYFNYFKPHTYLYACYQAPLKGRGLLREWHWKAIYILKWFAGFGLLFAIATKLCLIILLCAFSLEMRLFFKYHANFMFLICLSLLTANSLGAPLRSGASESVLPYLMIVATTCSLYLMTALKKMNRTFLSGRVISGTLSVIANSRRTHFDFYLPDTLLKLFLRDGAALSALMCMTVALEIALPFGLSTPSTALFFVALGAMMHLGFTFLFPVTLLHFSIVTVSTYLLFLDPAIVNGWINR